MAFVRRKIVETDGVSMTVAPLTCIQMEEFLETQAKILELEDASVEEKAKKVESLWFKFVADGLNNALNGASDSKKFSEDLLRKECDKPLVMNFLKPVIMEMSGIVERGQLTVPEVPSA